MTDERDQDWVEPRGPHLPGPITRVPGPVWPFLALAVLAAYGRWEMLRTAQLSHPIDLLFAIVGSVTPIAAPLLGAALFARHPDASRSMPAVVMGVVLFAASTVVDRLQGPVLGAIAGSDPDFNPAGLHVIGYAIVQALVHVFAATYLALGLADARRFEDRGGARGALAALVLAAIAAPVVTGLVGLPWPAEVAWLNAVALVAQLLTNLAWAYLGWTAFRGWSAGEEPRAGWALVAAAGIAQVVVALLVMLLNVALWVAPPVETQPALVFEVYQLLGVVVAGSWLALLAAFWLGLPVVDDPADIDEAANAA